MKRKSLFLVPVVFPLLAFSCVAVKTLALSPQVVSEPESAEGVALNFEKIASILERWADAEGYFVTACGPTPRKALCKQVRRDSTSVEIIFTATENAKVEVVNFSGWRIPNDVVNVLRNQLHAVYGPNSINER